MLANCPLGYNNYKVLVRFFLPCPSILFIVCFLKSQFRVPHSCPFSCASNGVSISMSEILHTLSMPEWSSQSYAGFCTNVGKTPILYFVIRASRQNWLCSRASQPFMALCKQLEYLVAQLHFILHRAQIGATDAGPGNFDNQFWTFHTYVSLDRLLFHMQFDLFN